MMRQNPVRVFWDLLFRDPDREERRRLQASLPEDLRQGLPSTSVFVVMRKMRVPMIVLILIFAVSTLGLSLMPGQDPSGTPRRLTIFESFYVMSYTATTIGYGEVPYAFSPEQRMWVTFSIYLSVVGWAYAVGSLLTLSQDRSFRRALARHSFSRKVHHLAEPFLVLVGYGSASRSLAQSLDAMGRRFVVIDRDEERASSVDLGEYRADAPTISADARDTRTLMMAGLAHPRCEGVVALTGDDETNLDVAMTTALVRPGLPVVTRSASRRVAERMRSFEVQDVVNPLDRFGDHLRILLRSPAAYQLMNWLTSAPGTPLPDRREPLPRGTWVVCGEPDFAEELTHDLCAEGIEVRVVAPADFEAASGHESADAFVLATRSDTTNLWLAEAAKTAGPDAYLVALQNNASNVRLFHLLGVDFGLLPSEVIVHEILARLSNPLVMRFLPRVPHLGEEWSAQMVDRLVARCGRRTPDLWSLRLDSDDAPAVLERAHAGVLTLGDLLRDPRDRSRPSHVVVLAVRRGDEVLSAPADDAALEPDDVLLVAGRSGARRLLDTTLTERVTAAYVLDGAQVPTGWLWGRMTRGVSGPR